MPNLLEKTIHFLSPEWAAKRAHARKLYGLYESALPSRTRRKRPIDAGDANYSQGISGWQMVMQARELCENYDAARVVLDHYSARIVGKEVQSQPLIERADGTLHTELNNQLKRDLKIWMEAPEITGMSGGMFQRLAVETWQRDGEFFTHFLEGYEHPHNTKFPISLEGIETDQIPYETNETDPANKIIHGVRLNKYNQRISYLINVGVYTTKIKEIPAVEMVPLQNHRRFGQIRGVTIFHSVFSRVEDLADYERSMRVKARFQSDITAQTVTDLESPYIDEVDFDEDYQFKAGTHYVNRPGSRIELVDSKIPNNSDEIFIKQQLRMFSRGVGTPYSTISGDYGGTSFSSMRGEIINADMLIAPKISEFYRFWGQIYRAFIKNTLLYRDVIPLREINIDTLFNASHQGPAMDWIDQLKSANAKKVLREMDAISTAQIIRESGRNPDDVFHEIKLEEALGIGIGTERTTPPTKANENETEDEPEEIEEIED